MTSQTIIENASLKNLNTFAIDVKSDALFHFNTEQDADLLCGLWQQYDQKMVLGGGSNVLFTGDYHGLIVLNELKGISVRNEDDEIFVTAAGGENWHEFVMYCVERGMGGIENLALIPGTVGAAPIQNIGAYGVELKDVFHSLTALDLETGELLDFDKDNCMFGYRNSIFKHELKGKLVIISVCLKLTSNHTPNTKYGAIQNVLDEKNITNPSIKDVAEAVISIRRSKLPDPAELGNAGSFFKNPIISKKHYEALLQEFESLPGYPSDADTIKVPAGWLIETCGWKGRRMGNTGAHAKQALVLVNYGNASGLEIIQHASRIIESVKDRFEITLQPEVNVI